MKIDDILHPDYNVVYFIKYHTVFQFLNGSGCIEVDFKIYHNWEDKLIFLEKGQYIKFLSDSFIVRRIELNEERIIRNAEVRVLFKHLVSLGHINLLECETCRKSLKSATDPNLPDHILSISSRQWYRQNPFSANEEEYRIIFDLKDIIDEHYRKQLTKETILELYGRSRCDSLNLLRSKVGYTVKNLIVQKRLLETKKDIAFTDKSIKEIAYNFGYYDPAYFNRVFSKSTGVSPMKFRESINYEIKDDFIPELYHLINSNFKEQRTIKFYAQKMNLSDIALSEKVKTKLNTTLGQLIRIKLTNSAKELLQTDALIKDIAYELGFEEANHFSSFFKHYTSYTPTNFRHILQEQK